MAGLAKDFNTQLEQGILTTAGFEVGLISLPDSNYTICLSVLMQPRHVRSYCLYDLAIGGAICNEALKFVT